MGRPLEVCGRCSTPTAAGARFCSRCGLDLDSTEDLDDAQPAAVAVDPLPAPDRPPTTASIVLGGLGGLVLVAVAVFALTRPDSVPGDVFEGPVAEGLGQTLDGTVSVTCPEKVRQEEGRIVDCSAVLPSGRQAQVFVTIVDGDGHFRYQAETGAMTAELQEKFASDAEQAQTGVGG